MTIPFESPGKEPERYAKRTSDYLVESHKFLD